MYPFFAAEMFVFRCWWWWSIFSFKMEKLDKRILHTPSTHTFKYKKEKYTFHFHSPRDTIHILSIVFGYGKYRNYAIRPKANKASISTSHMHNEQTNMQGKFQLCYDEKYVYSVILLASHASND